MANVEKIRIKNFKSHENFLQNIDRNFNHVVVHGRNGVGKTNLLESFSFFSNTKGMRGDNIEKVIPIMQNPKGDTDVSLVLFSKYNNLNLNIIFIFKSNCWSSIRICLYLKPYIFISRLMSMPS